MNRRSFIKRGLFGGALVGLVSLGLVIRPYRRRLAAPGRLHHLDEDESRTLAGIAGRVLPPQAQAATVVAKIDLALNSVSQESRADLKQLLRLFDSTLASLLLGGRLTPFSSLTGEEQNTVLGEWRDSRLVLRRTGYQALRKLCLAAYYGDEQSWPVIHYPGPPPTGGFFYPDSKWGERQ